MASLPVRESAGRCKLLVLLLALGYAAGLISSNSVMGSGLLITPVMPAIGLAKGAMFKVSYRFEHMSLPSNSAFLLLVDDNQLQTYYKLSTRSEDEYFRTVCNAPSAMRLQLSPDGDPGSFEFTVPYMGQFTGLLVQCSGYYTGILRLQVNTTTINPDRQGRLVNFLGLENLLLPAVYAGLLAASAVLLVVWLVDLSLTKKEVSAMHLACAAALAIKVMEAAVQLSFYTKLNRQGLIEPKFSIGNSFIQKLSTISELLMLFLLGLGWKVTRSQLSPREVRLLVVSFGLYLVFATSQSACSADPSQNKMCEAYVLTEYVIHSLILLGIIVSINFNLTHLRATLNDYPWSSNVPLQYQAMKDFQFYRLIFLLYLLLPTILLIIRIMLLSWAYSWLDELLHQGAVLAICVSVAVTYGPVERELYTRPFGPAEALGSGQQTQPSG